MKKQTKHEIIADAEWWRQVASVIGCRSYGFTYRQRATFITPDGHGTVEIPGWLALELRRLAGIDHLKKERNGRETKTKQ